MTGTGTGAADSIWTEVSLRVSSYAAEDVASLLQDFTGAGVAIEPPIAALGPDEGYTLDAEAPLVLRAYFHGPVPPSRRALLRRRLLRGGLGPAVDGRLGWRTLREEDWAEAWKANYNLERAGRIVVRPAWREYQAQPGETVISLDPGMAFGTGQHPTTRMCLLALQQGTGSRQQLEERELAGRDVLDLGCGSGILAIAAAALGAESCLAVDIEEQAVAASLANAALNDFEERIDVRLGSVDAVPAGSTFDLVLANINAATIIALARDIYGLVKPGGRLIASGIIAERAAACEEALLAAGFSVRQRMTEGEWRAIVAERIQAG